MPYIKGEFRIEDVLLRTLYTTNYISLCVIVLSATRDFACVRHFKILCQLYHHVCIPIKEIQSLQY